MLPHSNFGIRMRRARSKGYWWNKKVVKPKEEKAPDEGTVVGVSDFFKGLLRGKSEAEPKQ